MATRTSATHPIRVDFVPEGTLRVSGRLGMTFAPGKKGVGLDGRWERDLRADIDRLRGVYGVTILVSLVEDHELESLGIRDLVELARTSGIEVERLPIRDGGVPTDAAPFLALVDRTVAALRGGSVVVAHCRGGLGRTGVFAGAVLCALGESADQAMAIVRATRPGTIENAEQERFVRRLPLKQTALEPRCEVPPLARVRGCLLGGALGDALGEPVEFIGSSRQIIERFGATAPARLGYAGRARITDDTQMTLFAAEGILRAGSARWASPGVLVSSVQRAFLRWYATQAGGDHGVAGPKGWLLTERGLHHRRAPGNTCLSALAAQVGGRAAPTTRKPLNDSKGCGAIMRSAPFGLAARSRAQAFAWSRDAGVVTHAHASGYLSAAHFAAVVFDVARGVPLTDAITEADALLVLEPGHEETLRAVQHAVELCAAGPPSAPAIESLGGAWVGEEALAIGIVCAATCRDGSPEEVAAALWRSVAHAGDSDSTGSITGNLLGAMHGLDALPSKWLEELELREVIDRIATEVYRCIAGEAVDELAFPPPAGGAG